MILSCRACNRSWRYPCKPCRDGFIAYHLAEFGHEMAVHDEQPSQRGVSMWEGIPEWMTPRRKRNRDTA